MQTDAIINGLKKQPFVAINPLVGYIIGPFVWGAESKSGVFQ